MLVVYTEGISNIMFVKITQDELPLIKLHTRQLNICVMIDIQLL